MISIQISNTKLFMSKLLASDSFDAFLLDNAELKLATTISIDGSVNKEFFSGDDDDIPQTPFISWADERPVVYNLIKGKRTPTSFKFVMCTSSDKKNEVLEAAGLTDLSSMISSFVFIIKFLEGSITITTGAALSGFTLDKSYEKVWDSYVTSLLDSNQIGYELL